MDNYCKLNFYVILEASLNDNWHIWIKDFNYVLSIISFALSIGYYHIILILQLSVRVCVRESGRSREAIRPELKLLFIWRAVVGRLHQTARWYGASQEPATKIRSKGKRTCGSPVTTKELDSGVDVTHGCYTEGGDSTLGVFSWELLWAKL